MTRNSDHNTIFYIGFERSNPTHKEDKNMKKITVAHITDRVTFPGVQINHIEEIELDNVSGLVFVRMPLFLITLFLVLM